MNSNPITQVARGVFPGPAGEYRLRVGVRFPTIFYMTNVLVHLGLGTVLFLALLLGGEVGHEHAQRHADGDRVCSESPSCWRRPGEVGEHHRAPDGPYRPHRRRAAGSGAGDSVRVQQAKQYGGGWLKFRNGLAAACALLVIAAGRVELYNKAVPDPDARIRNPLTAPLSMEEEGGGPKSPFFPSSAKTNVGGIIPSNFFMDSEACGDCHKDIYEQWKGSSHHFASFNNQFYRKSIEYMQAVVGTAAEQVVRGLPRPRGLLQRPVREAHQGSDRHAGSAGRAGLHLLPLHHACGEQHGQRRVHHRVPAAARADDEQEQVHPRVQSLPDLSESASRTSSTFMKPFMRQDAAEFCSSCHKVHLDVPVNDYRWFRGFNDYDNWQASGVSGQGARSFYYPQEDLDLRGLPHAAGALRRIRASTPASCIRTGSRPPTRRCRIVNQDHDADGVDEQFLKSGFITVDIFAASPVDERPRGATMMRRVGDAPQAMSSFAVGEEAEQSGAGDYPRSGQAGRADRPAGAKSSRARRCGSMWWCARARSVTSSPAARWTRSTSGSNWRARTPTARCLLERQVEDDGKGPVEPGAHFYRSYQLDGDGNPINKRNAWQTRSVLYVRLIPPGAADVAHYRVQIPKDAKGPITLTAKLNYRKFSHYYTQFAYAGKPKPGQDVADHQGLQQRGIHLRPGQHPGTTFRARSRARFPNLPIITAGRAPPASSNSAMPRPRPHGSRWCRRTIASAGTTGASACCCRAT